MLGKRDLDENTVSESALSYELGGTRTHSGNRLQFDRGQRVIIVLWLPQLFTIQFWTTIAQQVWVVFSSN